MKRLPALSIPAVVVTCAILRRGINTNCVMVNHVSSKKGEKKNKKRNKKGFLNVVLIITITILKCPKMIVFTEKKLLRYIQHSL